MPAVLPSPPSESDLCTSCGICCRGGLFNRAKAEHHELDLIAALGLTVREAHDGMVFDLPCRFLEDATCTVYEGRPQTCRKFRCQLLRDFDASKISASEAHDKIVTARRLLDDVLAELPEGETLGQARERWRFALSKGGTALEEAKANAPLMLRLTLLNRFLDLHFYRDGETPFVACR